MPKKVSIDTVRRLLKKCAPGFQHEGTGDRIQINYNGALFHLNKGPGAASKKNGLDAVHSKTDYYPAEIRRLAEALRLDPACVLKHSGIQIKAPETP
jgi:hypothetical protein